MFSTMLLKTADPNLSKAHMHLALPETADFMAAELSRENLEDNIATAEGGVKRAEFGFSLFWVNSRYAEQCSCEMK